MQPLQRFGAFEVQKWNPYNVLAPLGFKNATPTAFWRLCGSKMQPLQRFGAPGKQKCNPYNDLGPLGSKNATPTMFCRAGVQKTGDKFSLQSLIYI